MKTNKIPKARKAPAHKETVPPIRKPGSMKGKIKIKPGFDASDKIIESIFHLVLS